MKAERTKGTKTIFQIPSFARAEAYNFEMTKETFEIYHELNQIAEEIERCRTENS